MRTKMIFLNFLALLTFLFSCEKPEISTTTITDSEDLTMVSGYPIVSTNQTTYFDSRAAIAAPSAEETFYGQDAQYPGNPCQYVDNGDGTITDKVTGLIWEKATNYLTWAEAEAAAAKANTGGYSDWRIPTIKELYSLVDFTGNQGTGNPSSSQAPYDAQPFIDTDYFDFEYPTSGRYIDVQYISSTTYRGTAIGNTETFFGLNLADGRIKAYPQNGNMNNREYPVRFVRGNASYGINQFTNNGDGTISDKATGLMWSQVDSGDDIFAEALADYTKEDGSFNWQEALHFSEKISYAGYNDWRLPDAKELQSILDYDRCPDATNSPAIDPVFATTTITNEAGQAGYPFFWTSTSFEPGGDAVIICFGRAMGYFDQNDPLNNSNPSFIDVHGAGCQRTDPKSGTPSYGFGPQGDVRRVYNYVRLVRDL